MTREEIISGLEFTVEMFLFNPSTGEKYTEPRNDMDKTTIDACRGAIELLKQEPTTKNDLGVDREDAVERLNALKQFIGYDKESEIVKATQKSLDIAIKALEQEPQIRPKGHWIEYSWNDNGLARWGLECDKCHKKYKYGGEIWNNPNYCPNCGADMRGVEE